jgi:hypothetical protein
MENYAITEQNIIKGLKHLPKNKLHEVNTFIQFLLSKSERKLKNESLAGIWANIGFEELINIDDEINIARKELGDSILLKEL